MANLTQPQKDALKSVGITGCKTVAEATEKMIEKLAQYQVTGVEDEPMENLIMYCQAFVGEESAATPTIKDESDAIAREVEQEDDDRAAEAEEDEDDEEELLPAAKPAPKKAAPIVPAKTKVVGGGATKASTLPTTQKAITKVTPAAAPTAAKKAANVAAKPSPVNPTTSIKFDARTHEEHMGNIAWLHEFFPSEETQYDVLKQGVTLRALMANTRPTVMNFDEVRINPDGTTIGNLYLNKFRSVEELLTFLPEGFDEKYKIGMFRGETHPSIKGMSQQAIIELFNTTMIVDETLKRVGKLDSKMGANRAKMVEALKSTEQKKAASVPAKKK